MTMGTTTPFAAEQPVSRGLKSAGEGLGALLAQLEEVTRAERRALVTGDWSELERCILKKHGIVAAIESSTGAARPSEQQLRQLQRATERNADLAQRLFGAINQRLKSHSRGATYTRNAKVSRGGYAFVHRTG